jgi:PAS domain S-box-containing protein
MSMHVLDASPNAIVATDESALITYANPQVESTFGYTREELLGQPIELLLPARARARHVAHRSRFLADPVARPMDNGLDLTGRRKDGTEFPVEISLSPVRSAEGLQVFATVVDITARKAAATALADSERRLRNVLEASPNAIVAVDEAGRIAYSNPQTEPAFGYERSELLGQPIELLLPARVGAEHARDRSAFLRHPVSRSMGVGLDVFGRRKDGTEFPVEISLSPVRSAGGLQVFATVVDITARKAAEGQLLQAQKLESIGRLAGGIAHDFNNMLFAIRGHAELLAQDLAAPPDAFDQADALTMVASITDAADRATSLTSQLLAFSRQQVVRLRVLDFNTAIEAVEPMLRPLIGANIALNLRLDPASGNVRMDPSQLDQILVNLAVNARDAMPDGGTITIETGNAVFDEPYALEHFDVTAGRYTYLVVTDTGVGMDRVTKEHIFEPFFTTKAPGLGTGLGLATIYGIVRQAGGHIWLYSEPGLGSSFKLYFPRVDASVAEHASVVDQPSAGLGMVLVVEDDPAVRSITSKLLQRAGFRVTTVGDGASALIAFGDRLEPIGCIVTDVVMPNMSGIELADRMHEIDPSVAIVLLSGYTAETLDLDRAMSRGAAFVAKPVSSGDLLDAVGRAMRGEPAGT